MTISRSPWRSTSGSADDLQNIINLLSTLDSERLCIIDNIMRVTLTIRVFAGVENIHR